MDQLLREIRHFLSSLAYRVSQLFREAPAGSLQVTGVLGLAAVLYGIYQFRASSARKAPTLASGTQRERRSTGDPHNLGQSSAEGRLDDLSADKPDSKASTSQGEGLGRPVGQLTGEGISGVIRARLSGVKLLTISAPGVLLEETSVSELQEAATLREEAVTVLKAVLKVASVYIITQVEDDLGEATCRGALEAGGLVGPSPGQIPQHRLLFCSTVEGKVSMVRQLEPQLHIDGHSGTTLRACAVHNNCSVEYCRQVQVEDLKRFINLLHICSPGVPAAGKRSPNVQSASSLAEFFRGGS